MALHPQFPASPYVELDPEFRWFPAAEDLRSSAYEKLLPPLVAAVRREVKIWRDAGYGGATATTRALLRWWFDTEHMTEGADGALTPFRYYLAVGFKPDDVQANGGLSDYVRDFMVRTTEGMHWIVETKGRVEIDFPAEMTRLEQWCADATEASRNEGGPACRFVCVDHDGFEKAAPKTFASLAAAFTAYQPSRSESGPPPRSGKG